MTQKINEIKLFEKARNGCDESIIAITNSHLKYVKMMAAKYSNYGVPYHELYSICKERLIHCMFLHDPTKGKFSSYIFSHMQKAACDAIRLQRQIHVPAQKWKTHKIECSSVDANEAPDDTSITSIDNMFSTDSPIDQLIYNEQYKIFLELLSELSPKEIFVIRAKNEMWFKLVPGKKVHMSFKEIGRYIDTTTMGVKVVHDSAIRKMKKQIKELNNE